MFVLISILFYISGNIVFCPRLPSKQENDDTSLNSQRQQQRVRPLYDVPYMWEAREFMRKKLVGKKVSVLKENKCAIQREFGVGVIYRNDE